MRVKEKRRFTMNIEPNLGNRIQGDTHDIRMLKILRKPQIQLLPKLLILPEQAADLKAGAKNPCA